MFGATKACACYANGLMPNRINPLAGNAASARGPRKLETEGWVTMLSSQLFLVGSGLLPAE